MNAPLESHPVADIGDWFELLDYLTRFWRFLFTSAYRFQCFSTWQSAASGKRVLLIIETVVSVACGLLPFWLVEYLIVPMRP